MKTVYPYNPDANEELSEICMNNIKRLCPDSHKATISRLNEELDIIRKQGSASGYLCIYHVLQDVAAKTEDFYFSGTLNSSLVAHALYFSNNVTLNDNGLRLYPELCYGISGEKAPYFQIRTRSPLRNDIEDYFQNYSGVEYIKFRNLNSNDTIGVYLWDSVLPEESEPFCFNFISIEPRPKNKYLFDDIIKIICPKSFSDYCKCYEICLLGSEEREFVKSLIERGISFSSIISVREDVYETLISHGIKKTDAYKFTSVVWKGKIAQKGWSDEQRTFLKEYGIQDQFIDSCEKYHYLNTRAHSMAVMSRYLTNTFEFT